MATISAVEAAQELGVVNPQTIYIYLKTGRLEGDYATGRVEAESLRAYRQSLIENYDAICRLLDDGELTDRQRDILTRRSQFQKLDEIGAALVPPITKSRVSVIIRRLLKQRLEIG